MGGRQRNERNAYPDKPPSVPKEPFYMLRDSLNYIRLLKLL